MDKQSSAATAFRALVMLGCLLGIPLVGLFGSSLPELGKQLWERHFGWGTASAAMAATDAPAFVPPGTAPPVSQASLQPRSTLEFAPTAPAASPRLIVPTSYQAPPEPIGTASPVSNLAMAEPVDRFTWIQTRLKELGSTYSLLETWGSDGQMYRFYCKMSIGGSANYTRYFEATEREPLSAMARVLQDVETWRKSRP